MLDGCFWDGGRSHKLHGSEQMAAEDGAGKTDVVVRCPPRAEGTLQFHWAAFSGPGNGYFLLSCLSQVLVEVWHFWMKNCSIIALYSGRIRWILHFLASCAKLQNSWLAKWLCRVQELISWLKFCSHKQHKRCVDEPAASNCQCFPQYAKYSTEYKNV